jgi:hypothetical protein
MDKRHQYFTYPLDGKRQHLRVKQLVVATPPNHGKPNDKIIIILSFLIVIN